MVKTDWWYKQILVTYSEDGVYSSNVKICNLTLLSKCKPNVLFESVSYCTVRDFEVNRTDTCSFEDRVICVW